LSAIFISYRREDTEDSARALYETLVPKFGADRLFMDVEAIALGSDFRQAVEHSLSSCGVFLAVIGPTWLDIKAPNDSSGKRRLDNPSDYVRQEIATALKKGADLPIIPVLVRGATMPSTDQLPEDLKDLAFRNALRLDHIDWDANVQKLVQAMRPHVGEAVTSEQAAPLMTSAGARAGGLRSTKSSPAVPSIAARSGGDLSRGLLAGIVAAVVLVGAVLYFVLQAKPSATLAVTLLKNSRLANLQGVVNVSIDDKPVGQIRFDSNGSTALQFQVPEGEHRFQFTDPQTQATCNGTFSVNPNQTKFKPRMRAGGSECALDTAMGKQ
jgi:hypothetical protein